MNDTIDRISLRRYQNEFDNQYQMTQEALENRKLSNKKLTMSQRILFTNKKNPFAGTDGFSHLLNREAQMKQMQNNSQAYRNFANQIREFIAMNGGGIAGPDFGPYGDNPESLMKLNRQREEND